MQIRILSENNPIIHQIHDDGFLEVLHLEVIKDDIIMFDTNFSIEYDNDTNLFGNLLDEANNNVGMTLNNALLELTN